MPTKLRTGLLTELVDQRALEAKVTEYVAALEICEPTVVASLKRQLNAIAAGDIGAAHERTKYEASLQSSARRCRLMALVKPK